MRRGLSAAEAAERHLAQAEPAVAPNGPARAPEAPEPTEFDFVLPRGYLDGSGRVHREGSMRLATARDELLPLHDARVQQNPAFLSVVLLGRVVTRLGNLDRVDDRVVENMWASDVAFLQDLYRRINTEGHTRAAVTCPQCANNFTVEMAGDRLGES